MSVTKPLLLVVAGPNGTGKTEITEIVRQKFNWTNGLVEVNPDNIAQKEFGNWNDPTAIRKAAQRADEIREECLIKRQGLLFETVLSIPEKIGYLRRAKEAGYFIRMIYVATETPEINLIRIAWRADQGGHAVPAEKVRNRYERSLKLAIEASQIVDRAYFVDNSREVQVSTDKIEPYPIFKTINGLVAKVYIEEARFPIWVKNIYKSLRPRHSLSQTQKFGPKLC